MHIIAKNPKVDQLTRTHFKRNVSETYAAALKVLSDLAETEGTDAARRVLADVVHEEYKRVWAEKYGLRPSTRHICLNFLIGRRHKWGMQGDDCIIPPGLDHANLWLRDGKTVCLTSQPYQLSGHDVFQLGRLAGVYDLDLHISTQPAWWFPGACLMVELWRKGERHEVR